MRSKFEICEKHAQEIKNRELLWKRKTTHQPAPVRKFSLPKEMGVTEERTNLAVPPDTELLLTKNCSEIVIFQNVSNFTRNSRKSRSFPEILSVQSTLKIMKNNSQGIIFVIISCERVDMVSLVFQGFLLSTLRTRIPRRHPSKMP